MTPEEYKKTMTFTERNKNAIEFSLWRWWKNYTWAKFLFLISPLVTVLVILAIFLVPTMWGKCGETIDYHIVGLTLKIDGVGRMNNYYHDPPWWPWHTLIRRVEISDGVTNVGLSAFYEFTNLREVEIPQSVDHIQGWAFQRCESLEEIYAPGVEAIFIGAFDGCTSLRTVELSQSGIASYIYDEAFQNCVSLETVKMNSAVFLESHCFQGCERLDGLSYLDPQHVGDFAFADCSSLTAFPMELTGEDESVPENRRRPPFGTGAFVRCFSLTEAVLPDGMTTIPEAMFLGCTSLTDVTLPEGITAIEEGAFYGCVALETLTLPESLRNIGKDAFTNCTGIAMLVIPDAVGKIDRTAFRRWTEEQTVLVPSLDLLPQGAAYSDAKVEEKRTGRGDGERK